MSNENNNFFSICFNMLKLRYSIYDESITTLDVLKPTDKVNVFINLETAWKYLSTVKDLERKLLVDRSFKITMISDIINVAAHYKEFFKNNGLDTKVYLYNTAFDSEIGAFNESMINEDFRSYYINKYNSNPKFVLLTEALMDDVLPRVSTLCEFIPDVYFINVNNVDSSMIPLVFAEQDKSRKNFVISGDRYETQFAFEDNFVDHLYLRSYANSSISCKLEEYVKAIFKTEMTNEEKELYTNRSFYVLLLACLGDKYRSIDGITGVSYKTITKLLFQGLNARIITKDTKSIDMIANIFSEDKRSEVIENFNALDMRESFENLLVGTKKEILLKAVDRSDLNGLMEMNRLIFNNDNQLHIESLLR